MTRDVVDYFVNVKRPLEIREEVLTTSNDLILLLKRTEKIKALRLQKKQALEQLKMQLKEINALNTQLKNALPRIRYTKDMQQQVPPQEKVKDNYMGQLQELQKAIIDIEDKLRGF